MVFDLAASTGFQLNRAARLMANELHAGLAELDLTPPQWALLSVVSSHPGEHQQQIARRLGSDRATLAELIGRMERRDLLERAPDPTDARRHLLHPGPAAQDGELLRRAEEAAEQINAAATKGFTNDERDVLLTLLRRIRANLADGEAEQ